MKYNYNEVKDKLFAPCILDILDDLGYRKQGMDYTMRPLVQNDVKIMGPAFTFLACEVYEEPEHPYKNEFEGLDQMPEGSVMAATTQGSMSSAYFGELLATRARYRGVRGAIIDGATRDIGKIMEMEFPLYCKGISPYDSKGRMDVIAYNVPIVCGGVLINPGDVIYAEKEGIAVIPADVVDKVIDLTIEKLTKEDIVRKELQSGTSAADVFDKYGVL